MTMGVRQHDLPCAPCQGFRQSKELKELHAKVKSLERYVSSSAREFEKEKEALTQAPRCTRDRARIGAAGPC